MKQTLRLCLAHAHHTTTGTHLEHTHQTEGSAAGRAPERTLVNGTSAFRFVLPLRPTRSLLRLSQFGATIYESGAYPAYPSQGKEDEDVPSKHSRTGFIVNSRPLASLQPLISNGHASCAPEYGLDFLDRSR
ncbi:MAG TPA: hypothetical protein VIU02_06965 [Burkholderiales bacterium]